MDWVGLLGRVLMSAIFIWAGYNKAVTPSATARWVLPVPGGPSSTTLRASARNAPEASAPTWFRLAGWASKPKSSRVLRAGKPAARMRSSAPEALRAETSRSSSAAR